MTLSSISSTQSQAVSGLVSTPAHRAKNLPQATAPTTSIGAGSFDTALASAIAGAMSQLGLAPTLNSVADNTVTQDDASTSPQPKASPQLQQYQHVASSNSGLAQALASASSNSSSALLGNNGLTSVFQDMWASLGASPAAADDAASDNRPSLPAFVQTLARNFSQSGVSGLRGVFIDTVA